MADKEGVEIGEGVKTVETAWFVGGYKMIRDRHEVRLAQSDGSAWSEAENNYEAAKHNFRRK